jgi:outer membrane protein OmpA-like peptidoglycan-associated protein
MNSKPLILAAFAIWCFISARWYVCGIKDACNASTPIEDVIKTPAIEPDTSDTHSEIQPVTDTKSTPPKKGGNSTASKPVSPDNMDDVQMEAVEDRMVIYFPYKSSRKEDNIAIDGYLSGLAQQLIASGEKVRITGHTDFVGEPQANYNFGLQRANSIRDILIKKGVPKAQIICKSYGDTKPVASNDKPYGRYLNRRAEIRVGK